MSSKSDSPRIGLSLSGGGSRAVAFHLGCLRALDELGILQRVRVISTVSGGSVIGGLYSASDLPFPEFEIEVRRFLKMGLVKPAIRAALTTSEGIKALLCWSVIGPMSLLHFTLRWSLWVILLLFPVSRRLNLLSPVNIPVRRFASRTTILMRALDQEFLKGKRLKDLLANKPHLIINAAELRTGTAFYFSPRESGSWRYGRLIDNDISLAHAVIASAAYPMILPALDEIFQFEKPDGSPHNERVILTDGGVYDNLGLSPLWPDRDSSVSLNVEKLDTIICCRAGYGQRQDAPTQFLLARLKSSFMTTQDRAQNAGLKRLFDLVSAGTLKDIVLPFLGQDDDLLAMKPEGFITRSETSGYPTDFSAMEDVWIDKLSKRGEQLTKALINQYTPHLVARDM